ncbi:MAG: TPM domain-containing protein [Acidobacteria bacterium]|nr:TPM domain-containing protein [Acidobacteriota bacterium]
MPSTTKGTMIANHPSCVRGLRGLRAWILLVAMAAVPARAQELPELTQPVNDVAHAVDASSAEAIDALSRALERASGDVVVVAVVDTFAPYADIREYAVTLFENRGRGVGARGRDNGLLVVLAVRDRQVWIEVGYDLEQFITDGFAGEISRQYMAPEFRRGRYGAGLLAGVSRIVTRIAERRRVTLQGVPREATPDRREVGSVGGVLLALFIVFVVLNALAARTRRDRRFGRHWGGPMGGWTSGVGPFGGGFGGFGGGGGGFGGGFGGFGGGRSGGGGGGAGW